MKDRKQRVRYKTKSVSSRKRLTVFRSNSHIYVQLIDDKNGVTLASASSLEKSIKDKNFKQYHPLPGPLAPSILVVAVPILPLSFHVVRDLSFLILRQVYCIRSGN